MGKVLMKLNLGKTQATSMTSLFNESTPFLPHCNFNNNVHPIIHFIHGAQLIKYAIKHFNKTAMSYKFSWDRVVWGKAGAGERS